MRTWRQRRSTLLTWCQVPFLVAKIASTSFPPAGLLPAAEHVDREGGQAHCAWRRERFPVGPLRGLGLDRAVDLDGAGFQVDVAPAQCKHFADPGPGAEHEENDVGEVARRLRTGTILAVHARTAVRMRSTSAGDNALGSDFGRRTGIDPRTGFEALAPSATEASSIAPVTTFASRCRLTLCVPRSASTASIPSVLNAASRWPPSVGTTSLRRTRSYSLIVVVSRRRSILRSFSQASTSSARVVSGVMGEVIVRPFGDVGRVALVRKVCRSDLTTLWMTPRAPCRRAPAVEV